MSLVIKNDAGISHEDYPECFGTYVSAWSDDCPEAPLCWWAKQCEENPDEEKAAIFSKERRTEVK